MDPPQDEAESSQGPSRQDIVPRPGSGVLIALRTRRMSQFYPNFEIVDETPPWQIQDLATERLTQLSDSFIRRSLRGSKRTTVAASGRFIYIVYDTSAAHIVCNPQERNFRRIAAPPAPGPDHSIVAMVVDSSTSQRYRIVQLAGWSYSSHPASRGGLVEVSLFDSRENGWRRLCSATANACSPLSSVILDGVLYAMLEPFPPGRSFELYSCDLDTGAWCFIDVLSFHELRLSLKTRPQLVTAAGRLFFVGYHRSPAAEAVINLSIWQITLPGERLTVTWVAYLMWALDGHNEREYWANVAPVQAVGCGDSIVVTTFLGRRWRWDVGQRRWHDMPSFLPLQPLAAGHSFFVAPFDIQSPAQ